MAIKIGFLGSGNMAKALMQGLLKNKTKASSIFAFDVDSKKLKNLKSQLKINTCSKAEELLEKSNIVILATKPQDLKAALQNLKSHFTKQIVISIAAGVDLATLSKQLPTSCKLLRSMPNNPALIGEGITALFSKNRLSSQEKKVVESVFTGSGEVLWVDNEDQLDAVTGLSGSGPAYVYQFVKALTQGGVKQGLAHKTAYILALKTLLGAALTLQKTGQSPEVLIPLVTSKKGTTLEGLNVLRKRKFDQTLIETVAAATRRAREIKKELKD